MKKKKLAILMSLFGILFLFCSCIENIKTQFEKNGMLQEHQLKRLKTFNSNFGKIDGGVFFGVHGSMGSEQVLQFWWEIKPNEMIATSIPISKFKFIIDESKKTPTIKFIFNDGLNGGTTTPFEELDINRFLDCYLKFCVVRLSQETLENEVYLPK